MPRDIGVFTYFTKVLEQWFSWGQYGNSKNIVHNDSEVLAWCSWGDSVIACLSLDHIHTSDPNSCMVICKEQGCQKFRKISSHNIIPPSILLGLGLDNPVLWLMAFCCLKDQMGFLNGLGQKQGRQEESKGIVRDWGSAQSWVRELQRGAIGLEGQKQSLLMPPCPCPSSNGQDTAPEQSCLMRQRVTIFFRQPPTLQSSTPVSPCQRDTSA